MCLHYLGVDIETTTHSFAHYKKNDQQILPITELIPMNLLDVTDSEVLTFKVNPKDLVQAYKLAVALSRDKKLIHHNLRATYHQLVHQATTAHQYDFALQYARQSRETDLVKFVGHQAASYFVKSHKFHEAKKYLALSKDPELKKYCSMAEGSYLYKQKKYEAAARILKPLSQENYLLCYKALFFQEQEKIKGIKNIAALKHKKQVLKKMEIFAKKSEDRKLLKFTQDLLKRV